jgi:ABC-type sugar transport system ATPase subunit/ribose/xylose/arabinose/galactoside ABC-type transport system permease subunit
MSALVELVGISKTFPGVHALEKVDLTLGPGHIHALVGENGAGKSTLINILSGVLQPDGGEIRLAGQPTRLADARSARRHGLVTVHQEVDLFPDLTVAENIGLEQGLPANRLGWIDWRRQWQQTRAALEAVGEDLAPAAPAGGLSPAQRQVVQIAAAVSQSARVLIFDEPTSSLSEAEAHVLFAHLRRFRDQGAAILYVSHRLEEIFALADEVTVLRDGRRVWSGPLDKCSPQQLIGLMVGREPVTFSRGSESRAALGAVANPLNPVRFRCAGLTAADGTCTDISLEVRGGEVVGLYGLIGAGRSEWAQAVFGLRRLAHGQVVLDGRPVTPRGPGRMARHGLAYVPEDRLRQGLCRGLSVRANVVLASLRQLAVGGWAQSGRETRRTRWVGDLLQIRYRSPEQPAGTLSGGNQQKVVLGRWLACEPAVLILDEPTRGVDVAAKAEIHALVRRFAAEGRAVVLISSDLPEVLALSDRIGVFREGRLVVTLDAGTATAEQIAAVALPAKESAQPALAGDSRLNKDPVIPSSPHPVIPSSLREAALLVLLLALFAYLEWQTGRFVQAGNLRNLATDAALLSFCALGATLVLVAGGLDISLGALMALSAGVAGRLWEQGWPWPLVAAAALLVGATGGLLNAALALAGRVHPIVVTLGTMSVYRGLTLWWLAQDVQVPGRSRDWLFAEVGGLPVITWSGLAVLAATWLLLTRTLTGRELYALGSNPAAAHRVGIHRTRVWLTAFTLQGGLAGFAGLVYLARSGNLQPTSYEDKTLEAIAAAVVGGVALTGGRGSVWGMALGCLFLVALPPACLFLQVSPLWQRTLVGGVLVVAVLIDTLWRRRGP